MKRTEYPVTKAEYMKILSHRLRRLPKEDFGRAIEYFEEYFEEAGPEYERQAIEDLGSPEEAANALIIDLASQNAAKPPKTLKRGVSAVWVGILAVFAAPIAIPLAVSLVLVIGAVFVTIGICLLCVLFSAVGIAAAGILSILGGTALLFRSAADALCNIGCGFFLTGAGILFIYGVILLFRWFIRKVSVSLSKITKGGQKK